MSGKVVDISANFNGEIPPKRVLDNAIEADLQAVVVMGWRKSDDTFYIHSSYPDGPEVVYLCQLGIKTIMDVQDQED